MGHGSGMVMNVVIHAGARLRTSAGKHPYIGSVSYSVPQGSELCTDHRDGEDARTTARDCTVFVPLSVPRRIGIFQQ